MWAHFLKFSAPCLKYVLRQKRSDAASGHCPPEATFSSGTVSSGELPRLEVRREVRFFSART